MSAPKKQLAPNLQVGDDAEPVKMPDNGEQAGPEALDGRCDATPADLDTGLKFFGNRICPFAHRTWWSALEVNAPIEYIHVDMGSKHAEGPNGKPWWYVNDVNPLATVPSLYDEGDAQWAISGTFEIDPPTDHILRSYAGLVPPSKEELHASQMHVGWMGGRKIVPQMYSLLQEQDPAVALTKATKLTQVLRECNARMEEQGSDGPFFLGSELSYADIAIVPFFDRFEATLGYYRGYELLSRDDPSLARMRALLDASREREAFKQTSQEAEFYIKSYSGYGQGGRAEKMVVPEPQEAEAARL